MSASQSAALLLWTPFATAQNDQPPPPPPEAEAPPEVTTETPAETPKNPSLPGADLDALTQQLDALTTPEGGPDFALLAVMGVTGMQRLEVENATRE
mgnify:CR=1 FL=1